jgi:hypothetical protein
MRQRRPATNCDRNALTVKRWRVTTLCAAAFHSNTLVHGDWRLVISDEAYDAIPETIRTQQFKEAAAAIPNPFLDNGEVETPVARDRPWALHGDT